MTAKLDRLARDIAELEGRFLPAESRLSLPDLCAAFLRRLSATDAEREASAQRNASIHNTPEWQAVVQNFTDRVMRRRT